MHKNSYVIPSRLGANHSRLRANTEAHDSPVVGSLADKTVRPSEEKRSVSTTNLARDLVPPHFRLAPRNSRAKTTSA